MIGVYPNFLGWYFFVLSIALVLVFFLIKWLTETCYHLAKQRNIVGFQVPNLPGLNILSKIQLKLYSKMTICTVQTLQVQEQSSD